MKNIILFSLFFSFNSLAGQHVFSAGEKITVEKINENFQRAMPEIKYIQQRVEGTGTGPSVSTGFETVDLTHEFGTSSRVSVNLTNNEIIIAKGSYDLIATVTVPKGGSVDNTGNVSCDIYNATDSVAVLASSSISHVKGINVNCQIMGILHNDSETPKIYKVRRSIETSGAFDHVQSDAFSYDIFANIRIMTLD